MAFQIYNKRKVFAFTWILENFEFCEKKTGHFLKSPTFIVDTIDRSKWSLFLYPRGAGNESKSWLSLRLNREKDSKGPVTIEVDFELALLAVDGSVLTSQSEYKQAFWKNKSWRSINFVERESVFTEKSMFLPHGRLMIRCRMWKTNGEANTDGQCIARTCIGVERRAFLWKIPNFSTAFDGPCAEETFKLNSTSNDKPIMSSTLFLFDKTKVGFERYEGRTLFIDTCISDESILYATLKLSIIDADGNYVHCSEDKFWSAPKFHSCIEYMLENTLLDKKDQYLPDDTLTIYFEVVFSTGTVLERIEGTVYGRTPSFMMDNLIPELLKTAHIKKSDSNLKVDLGFMLNNKILCDVKLCTESETFPAHRLILGARSPVFRAMFQNDMQEKVQDRVNIEDLKPDTVRRMLLYMYTDSLEILGWETASDLYVAAEKYQIMTLKDKCSFFLKANLSLSNACDILILSDLHQDTELKSNVQSFIMKNDKTIINSSDWKLLMKDNLHLAAETMLLKFKE